MLPMVSVIVPIYNVERYLKRCLESILSQTYTNYEIICINDSSTDNSQSIMEMYKNNYSDKIRAYNNEENLGIADTRDKGIKLAQGKYCIFIDSDDYVKSDYIETFVNTVKNDEDVIMGGYIQQNNNGCKTFKVADSEFTPYLCITVWTRMYKLSFLRENNINFGGFRKREDTYFNMMVQLKNPKIAIIDYQGYYYVDNPTSITSTLSYKTEKKEEIINVLDAIYKQIDFDNITDVQSMMIEYVFIANIISWLGQYNGRCGIQHMREAYAYCFKMLKKYFPRYQKNKFASPFKIKYKLLMSRMITWGILLLNRVHLDKIVFYLRALI